MSFRWLAVLLFPLALQAAPMETMAWHFPKMPNLYILPDDQALSSPPDATSPPHTVFADSNEKLKDLSGPFREHFKLGDDCWLIWNETRKLLVAHATPIALWQIERHSGYENQPKQLAISIFWYQGIEPGQPVPPDAKPVHSATIVVRSGQKSLQTWASSDSARFVSEKIEAESSRDDGSHYVDSTFIVDWQENLNGKTYSWNYTGAMILKNDSAQQAILAQVDSPIGGSWTLTAEASIVLINGHPVTKGRLREVEGKEVSSSQYPDFIATKQIARIPTSKGEVLFQIFPAFDLFLNAQNRPEGEADPFSPSGGRRIPDDIATGKQITTIPEELKPWFPQFLVDVRDRVRSFGINIPDNGLAGLESTTGQLFLAGLDSTELDKMSQLTIGGCNLQPYCTGILENLESSSKTNGVQHHRVFVVCRNGQRSHLSCSNEKNASLIYFEIEPLTRDSGDLVDLRFYSKRASPAHEYNGSMTLPAGIEVKNSQITTESGDLLTESLKASVFRFSDPD